ncbi:MAG: hypothetical protein RL329_198 [Bacteroidota bacterium]
MRKIIYTIWLFFAFISLGMSQLDILQCYNELPIGTDNPIKRKGFHYETTGSVDQKITVKVDTKNGFLEWFDTGTGGGTIHVQLAKFKKEDGGGVVVYKKSFSDGGATELYLQTFNIQKDTLIEVTHLLPMIYIGTFVEPNRVKASKDTEELALRQLNFDVQLPQKGMLITGKLMPESLRSFCKTQAFAGCPYLKNLRYTKIALVFDRKTGKFSIGSKS